MRYYRFQLQIFNSTLEKNAIILELLKIEIIVVNRFYEASVQIFTSYNGSND